MDPTETEYRGHRVEIYHPLSSLVMHNYQVYGPDGQLLCSGGPEYTTEDAQESAEEWIDNHAAVGEALRPQHTLVANPFRE